MFVQKLTTTAHKTSAKKESKPPGVLAHTGEEPERAKGKKTDPVLEKNYFQDPTKSILSVPRNRKPVAR